MLLAVTPASICKNKEVAVKIRRAQLGSPRSQQRMTCLLIMEFGISVVRGWGTYFQAQWSPFCDLQHHKPLEAPEILLPPHEALSQGKRKSLHQDSLVSIFPTLSLRCSGGSLGPFLSLAQARNSAVCEERSSQSHTRLHCLYSIGENALEAAQCCPSLKMALVHMLHNTLHVTIILLLLLLLLLSLLFESMDSINNIMC